LWAKYPHSNAVRRPLVAATVLLLVLAGVTAAAGDGADPDPPVPSPSAHRAAERELTWSTSTLSEPTREPRELSPQVADPVLVSLPAIGIAARLRPLHLDKQRRLVPPEYGEAGWYQAGPEPGEPGRAVIAGHVDTEVGPDVFYGLGETEPGQRILVRLEDGTELTFRVKRVEQFSRGDFPTQRVYGDAGVRELRLITCGGDFDSDAGHYQDNLVVFARLAT